MIVCYGAAMLPWFLRNLEAIGTILPDGGMQTIWFSEYDDCVSYTSTGSPEILFSSGLRAFLSTRWLAIAYGLATLIVVEGVIIIAPLMLLGLWQRRIALLLRGFIYFNLGIHALMCLVFPLPGYRGGLFHASAALFPSRMVVGALG